MEIIDAKWDCCIGWVKALAEHTRDARELLSGFDRQLQESLGCLPALLRGPAALALREGSRALHLALGSHFGGEVDELAEAIGVEPEALILANLAYDLSNTIGCSTFVARSERGTPLHVRSLDWLFPGGLL